MGDVQRAKGYWQPNENRLWVIALKGVDSACSAPLLTQVRVCRYRAAHSLLHHTDGRITKVYESETYDYPTQIQESLSEISSSIGYNITSFAATNLKGTNLPVPAAPAAPPAAPHKTLPHALVRAAHTAATTVSTTAPSAETDRLGKALGLYAQGWERVAGARLDQDANIADNFLHP